MPESSDRLRCNYKLTASGVQGVKSPEGTATGSFIPADFFVPADLQSAGM